MMRVRLLAVVAGLVAVAAALPTPGAAGDLSCTALAASRIAQNDAKSGRDAGDGPEGAVPIVEEDYVWGFLEAPAFYAPDTGASDLHDWFTAPVPEGPRSVSFGIVARPWYEVSLPVGAYPYPPLPLYHLDVWKPGAAEPFHATSADGNFTVFNDEPGVWLFHGYVVPYIEQPLCSAPGDVPSLGLMPEDAQNYGVYFGCKPFCLPGQARMLPDHVE